MTIKEAFSSIVIGFNLSNSSVDDNTVNKYNTLQKDSIQNCSISPAKLVEKTYSNKIKDKYFLKENDIVIYLKKPFKVGICLSNKSNIVVTNNFVILRGINTDLYSPIFVAYYLEKIGIKKFIERNDGNNKSINIEHIKTIELPNIEVEKQRRLNNLFSDINNRTSIYDSIISNDNKIIKHFLCDLVGENYEE